MSESLFDLSPVTRPRVSNRAQVAALKKEHGIWTHYAKGCGWLAVCIPKALELLKGYGLSEEEKSNPVELVGGYGRLIDESGLSVDGGETELKTVEALVAKPK